MHRSLALLTATVTSAALSLAAVPAAGAVSSSLLAPGSSAPADADAASGPIFRAVAGVGADGRSVNFSWRTTHTGAEIVRYAPVNRPTEVREAPAREADYGALAYLSKFAEVSDLEPGQTYTYQLGSEQGGWSAPESFTIDDGDGTWSFIAVTDVQIGVGGRVAEQAATWRRTAENATAADPDASLILSLGDQVEGWGDLIGPRGQYNAFFSAPQLRSFRTAAIQGNHETYASPIETKHFQEHWNLPNELGDTSNYFFEQNNALFIALNSNRKDAAGLAEQAQFVRDTVAAHGAGKDWIIVANHFAFHSQGGRYTDDDIVAMREALSPVFSEVGVDLVLNGHDHMYNRSHLMNGLEPTVPDNPAQPGDVLEQREGDVLYLTLNTAVGGKFYDYQGNDGKDYPDMTLERSRELGLNQPTIAFWNQDRTPDYSLINVTPESINVRSLNAEDGSLVDDITLVHDGAANPANPSNL
ncbi:metallophosphoesterase family protein [uncultured Corynebacterium sp.]|uniref:purple acid phosphatase family protein n=1 Tax=uncultured Corynebacterium sp. TaxID=159447 RepID=UPI002591E6F5|nr:metallophosphoesterase family protein [uncultured Corynebacterium sp.]